QLIGLTRQNILKMLALEQMIVFLITGVVGVLCGIAGAQLLLSIVSKLMSLSSNLSIHFEPMALVLTIFMLVIAYILIL
ncbi:FtsX-like permease family protein, partial [Enterococcus faecalis]|uniref:FtsX-like permease family protein n=1 Tax=Enterococcus faecalis TaxID=1351 RepID=UPI003D6A0CE3